MQTTPPSGDAAPHGSDPADTDPDHSEPPGSTAPADAVSGLGRDAVHGANRDGTTSEGESERLARIEAAIRLAAGWLPRQGPITQFAFLNPLQGLEEHPFDEVMRRVKELFGNEPYLDDQRYRDKLRRGRIAEQDLRDVVLEELGDRAHESVVGLATGIELRLAMLLFPFHFGPHRELDWVLAETDALRRFRPELTPEQKQAQIAETRAWLLDDGGSRSGSLAIKQRLAEKLGDDRAEHKPFAGPLRAASADPLADHQVDQLVEHQVGDASVDWESVHLHALWRVIRGGLEQAASLASPDSQARSVAGRAEPVPGRAEPIDGRAEPTGPPVEDSRVDELMIRFTAAFLDQGHAARPLSGVERGYWHSFSRLHAIRSRFAPRWRRSLPEELTRIDRAGGSPLQVIADELDRAGVSDERLAEFLRNRLLSLRGFAGMIWQTETRPDLFRRPSPPGSLIEFLAVRLLLSRLAKPRAGAVKAKRSARKSFASESEQKQQTFLLFELAQAMGWTPRQLAGLQPEPWRLLREELNAFGDLARRRVFHAAYERWLAKMTLHAFATRVADGLPAAPAAKLQVVCCIDAREESLRRHLEELDAEVETFGIAGFFGVAMYYRGAGDAGFSSLCPIVIQPQRWVVEEPAYSLEDAERTRAQARRWIGWAQRQFRSGSRSSLGGAVASTLIGPWATIPLLSRILLPRVTARMSQTARQFVAPSTITRLRLERDADAPAAAPSTTGDRSGVGFTLGEMTDIAERALRDIGLTIRFTPLVILLGHGSTCVNNPHESAYHCGACAGNAGGPNARALSVMLNDFRVRRNLAARGLEIPEETYFLAGQHNTATEELMFFDQELLPTRKVEQVREARRLLAEAALRNARERCRRFESAPLEITPRAALLHVQNRSADLAQTRPEYGNGSNAICFVGRRQRIRGLFLDRRSFLMSYDPTQDGDQTPILARILGAVVPVCQGINSLYSFSAIDPIGWGSGTKLPHNVTSLLGVMDGAASDLRPGLPWQGVEIHEPVRLLFIIETTPDRLSKLFDANPAVGRILRNHWAHVATLDPTSGRLHRYSKDRFVEYHATAGDAPLGELPTAIDSHAWYRGSRDHLPFAWIRPGDDGSLSREPVDGPADAPANGLGANPSSSRSAEPA